MSIRREPENQKDLPAVSFKVDVIRLPESGLSVRMDASPEELEALAARHGVEEVRNFHVEFKLSRWKMKGVRARGYVDADIVQRCVATLDPVETRVKEEIDTIFLPDGARPSRNSKTGGGELMIDFEGEDPPVTFSENKIDLGVVAEEFFDLGIDRYPRKEGAGPVEEDVGESGAEGENSPFAALGKLTLDNKQRKD